jgi:hypothetical protein
MCAKARHLLRDAHATRTGRLRRTLRDVLARVPQRSRGYSGRQQPALGSDRGTRRPLAASAGQDRPRVSTRPLGGNGGHARRQPELEPRRQSCSTWRASIISSLLSATEDDGSFQPSASAGRPRSDWAGRSTPNSRSTGAIRFPAPRLRKPSLQSLSDQLGGMSERPKELRCKRNGSAYAGSNPAPPTPHRARLSGRNFLRIRVGLSRRQGTFREAS